MRILVENEVGEVSPIALVDLLADPAVLLALKSMLGGQVRIADGCPVGVDIDALLRETALDKEIARSARGPKIEFVAIPPTDRAGTAAKTYSADAFKAARDDGSLWPTTEPTLDATLLRVRAAGVECGVQIYEHGTVLAWIGDIESIQDHGRTALRWPRPKGCAPIMFHECESPAEAAAWLHKYALGVKK